MTSVLYVQKTNTNSDTACWDTLVVSVQNVVKNITQEMAHMSVVTLHNEFILKSSGFGFKKRTAVNS